MHARARGDRMHPDRPDITVVTDISANIFAVFLLIMILLLALRERSPPPPPPAVLDVVADLNGVERAPLRPAEMVGLLYGRRKDAGVISIDLLADRIEIAIGGRTEQLSGSREIRDRLRRLAATGEAEPIGIYVFSHRWYATVTDALPPRAFREASVPLALRRTDPSGGWSLAFTALLTRSLDLPAFRIELARLLQSPRPAPAPLPQPRLGGGGIGSAPNTAPNPGERIWQFARNALDIGAICAGFVFVLAVERRYRRRKRAQG
jgi:hypothetical protein